MDSNPLSLPVLFQALVFASENHRYQRRSGYDRLPYLNHLIKVTDGLIRIGRETDRNLLLAALLHDVVEDTEVTPEQIARLFGPIVAEIVLELTDDMQRPYEERKRLQVERAGTLSIPARKIRIADKACNIADLVDYPEIDWPMLKKRRYVSNAVLVVNQIRGINPELEDWFDREVERAEKVLGKGV